MTIKVQNPGAQPVVATTQQIVQLQTDLSINPGAIDANAANSLIGNNQVINTATQQAINGAALTAQAYAIQRANHTGFDPATNVNVTLPSTGVIQTLQAYINALEVRLTALGSSAPANTVQPAAPTGTLTVSSTLTALTGTWTGASIYKYVWYRVNATTGVLTATGGTSSTYVIQPADAGFKMAVSVAGVSSAGVTAGAVFSAFTTAVGVTLPTNSVVPAITPSGSSAVGTLWTTTNGTWTTTGTGAFTYQWVDTTTSTNVVGATSNTYTSISGQAGHTFVCQVTCTDSQGTSASAATSNTVTATGTPVLTQLTAPSFSTSLVQGVATPVTNATFSGGTPTLIGSQIYIDTMGSTSYGTLQPTNGQTSYTPQTDANTPQILINNGITSLATHGAKVGQTWLAADGSTFPTTLSGSSTIAAPSATLAATGVNTNISATQSQALTTTTLFSISGGTAPFTSVTTSGTSSPPAGLTAAVSGSNVVLSGTPTSTSSLATYSVTISDSAGSTPVVVTYQVTVSAVGVVALPSVFSSIGTSWGVDAPNDADVGQSRFYEKGLAVPNGTYVSNTTSGFTLTSLSQLSTLSIGGVTRFGYDPKGSLPMVQKTIGNGDPIYPAGLRSGFALEGAQYKYGWDNWFGLDLFLDPTWSGFSVGSGQNCAFFDSHCAGTPSSGFTGAQFLMGLAPIKGGVTQNPPMWLQVPQYSGGVFIGLYNWAPNYGGHQSIIGHFRAGGPSNNPIFELWIRNGAGSWSQLSTSPWPNGGGGTTYPNTSAWGDPTGGGGSQGNDYLKFEIYNGSGATFSGTSPMKTWTSDLFWKSNTGSTSYYANAQASLAPYGVDTSGASIR